MILVGVSRSGKTPTSLYLAMQHGIKAANYPLIPEDFERGRIPSSLAPFRAKCFGLTIDPDRLARIRNERRPNSKYASIENCRYEVQRGRDDDEEGRHRLAVVDAQVDRGDRDHDPARPPPRPADVLSSRLEVMEQVSPGASAGPAFESAKRLFFEGLAALKAGRLEDAERAFVASLEAVPGRVSTLLNLGTTRLRMHRPLEAIAAADAVLASQPDDIDALGIRAIALARMGLQEQALAAYDRVVAADPHLAEMWSQRGSLLREMGRLEEAATSYVEARERGDDSVLNDYYLAGVSGGTPPPAAPPDYVERLFDDYSDEFEAHLVGVLGYRGPDLLVENLPEPGRRFASVLDLGCGTGLCGPLLKPRSERLTGIDLAAGMLERARAHGVYDRLERAEVVDWLEANHESFDLIVSVDVLIYIGDLEGLFAGARRALASSGLFCFSIELSTGGDDGPPFSLQPSLRFTHSARYIRELAVRHDFTVVRSVQATLREDRREAVEGIYFYLTTA